MSRNQWYWTLQLVGWSSYAILGTMITSYFEEFTIPNMIFQFLAASLMLTGTHLTRYWMKSGGWLQMRLKELVLRIVPTLLAFAFVTNSIVSVYGIYYTDLVPREKFSIVVFLLYTLQTFIYYALWFVIYLVIHYFRNYKREEIEKWRLQSAVKDAELIALKAQINPHFLFNALNNIRALILEDHMKARDMVSHLSELLRYSIQFNSNEKVTIWEELDIVEKYLELETIHYENRLSFEIEADKKLQKYKIPPMIIQLMAENAVKHGISQVKEGGEINVAITSEDEELILEVSNTGELKGSSEVGGIGIRNAMERIRILFEKEPELALFQDGNMVRSILKLPIER